MTVTPNVTVMSRGASRPSRARTRAPARHFHFHLTANHYWGEVVLHATPHRKGKQ